MAHGKKPSCRLFGVVVRALALVALTPLWVAAQTGGQDLEGKPVVRIDLLGLRNLEASAVKAMMETKEGSPFRGKKLERDIKTLVARDLFVTIPWVKAEATPDGKGVIVTLEATEVTTRALRVVFLGAVNFKRDELQPLIRTRAGQQINDFTLMLDREALLAHYKKEGYHFAEVGFVKRREADGDLVLFRITEGPKVSIRKVIFEGELSFPPDELMAKMPFVDTPGIFSSKEFNLKQVERDAVQLQRWYTSIGYLDAKVLLMDWVPTPNHEKVDLFFKIDEGKPYVVRSVKIEGMTLFDPAEFMELMRTKAGQRYEPGGDLNKDRSDIRKAYRERGYIEAVVADASQYDIEKPEVDVILRITEGNLNYTGEIIIRGNRETKDRIIRREIEVYTGEPLNLQQLERAERRIRSLRYWDLATGVRREQRPIPFSSYQIYKDAYVSLAETDRDNVKDVIITLEEQDTGSLRFAAGVGSTSGFIGDITYRKENFDPLDFPEGFDDILDAFTGSGQFLTLSFQPGTIATRWRVAWGNPRLFDSPYGTVADVFRSVFRREDWDEDRLGYSLRVSRRLGQDLSAALTLRDEVVDTEDLSDDAPQLVFDFEGENRLTTLTLDARFNRLDNFLDPADGFIVNLSYEHAGLWGDIEFDKVQGSIEHYSQLFRDESDRVHVLQLRATAGWASERGGTRDIPVYERFFLGGANSLRGFDFRGVGPEDNNSPIGGKAIWTAGVQYAYPLLGDQLRGVAFMDMGSIAIDWQDDDIWKVRMSVGVGIRLVIPFLGPRPIAIDFGFPLLEEDEDETLLISFNFGSNF